MATFKKLAQITPAALVPFLLTFEINRHYIDRMDRFQENFFARDTICFILFHFLSFFFTYFVFLFWKREKRMNVRLMGRFSCAEHEKPSPYNFGIIISNDVSSRRLSFLSTWITKEHQQKNKETKQINQIDSNISKLVDSTSVVALHGS